MVEPVDPFGGGDLDVVEGAPGSAWLDQLGLEQPVDRSRPGRCRRTCRRCPTDGGDARPRPGVRCTGSMCIGWVQLIVATPRSMEVVWWAMRERQRQVQLYRGQMPSPGRPTVAWREDRVRFWAAIARGAETEDAAVEAGVSPAGRVPLVPPRWRRGPESCRRRCRAGTCRFAEREDIAIWHAQKVGRARDRPPAGPRAVDDLAGAAAQRVHAHVAARLPGVDRAVACRAAGAPAEGREAGRQRAAARVRAGPARRCRSRGRTAGRCRARTADVEGPEQAAPRRPALGAGRGARSRSRTGCRSTSPMMSPCGSATRRSTRRCTSRAAARSSASWSRACAPGGRCGCRGPGPGSKAWAHVTPEVHDQRTARRGRRPGRSRALGRRPASSGWNAPRSARWSSAPPGSRC